MMTLVLISCFCVFGWLWLRWRAVRHYWRERGVPHAPPHPVLGSLTFLMKQNPALWMQQLYAHFRAPYIGIWLFWRPALVVTSPELARRILVADSDCFRDRLLGSGGRSSDPIGALNLFTINEPRWSSMRRRLTPAFTSAKLKLVETLVQSKCSQLVERIKIEKKSTDSLDVRTFFADMTTDIISISAFGVDGNATLEGQSPMREITKEFMKYDWHRGLSWASIFFIPEVIDIFRFKMFPKKTTDYLRKIFSTIVARRGGYDKEINVVNDLLDALLKMKQEAAKDGEEITTDMLVAQAAIFLQGGFDTTSVALTFCTYELAFAPQIQENLYNELMHCKSNLNKDVFDSNTLTQLPYLNGVMNETLRKYAPMGWIDRIASEDYQIDQNLTISAGTPVYVNACSTHFDPQYFPDPEQFIPERFLPENAKNIKPFTFIPFGEGPRHCIGKRFALQTFRHCLAALLLNFRIKPLPTSVRPNEVQMEKKGLFIMPAETLYVEFIDRK